jgi:hypothetical protein
MRLCRAGECMPLVHGQSRLAVVGWLCALAGLACLAYARALTLPPISDDYLQIGLARLYGPISGWAQLAQDPLYRCRATSLVLTYWTERLFGVSDLACNVSSLLLHVLCTWAVAALGLWRAVGWKPAFVAAAFFAVYQGHQEAVIWYAALPELLVFLFTLLALLAWIRWSQAARPAWGWWLASLVGFLLALLSKESAVILVPLQILVLATSGPGWRRVAWAGPFAALAVTYCLLIISHRATHYHFNDAGTFSIGAPFWVVWPRSYLRLLWVWGLVSVVTLAALRDKAWLRLGGVAALWIAITLLPYSFLTYMPHVPSRHTYFASAGLALLVAAGYLAVSRRFVFRAWLPYAVATVIVMHQCVYLWTRKHQQYVRRAAPTEELIRHARRVGAGTLRLACFPYDISIARYAVDLRVGSEVRVQPASDRTEGAAVACISE